MDLKCSLLTTPFGLDSGGRSYQVRQDDILRRSAEEHADPKGYTGVTGASSAGDVDYVRIVQRLLDERGSFLHNDTVYLIVDSRQPEQVDYWHSFRPWWGSRRKLVGPMREKTDLVWYHLDSSSGLVNIPYIWAGTFVLETARFLFSHGLVLTCRVL
eukprot:Skav212816  [mRNA]  locus=scaffold4580:34591:35061:+ [translate_table: standard]